MGVHMGAIFRIELTLCHQALVFIRSPSATSIFGSGRICLTFFEPLTFIHVCNNRKGCSYKKETKFFQSKVELCMSCWNATPGGEIQNEPCPNFPDLAFHQVPRNPIILNPLFEEPRRIFCLFAFCLLPFAFCLLSFCPQ